MAVSLDSRYADGHYSRNFPDPRKFRTTRDSKGGYLGPTEAVVPVVLRNSRATSTVSNGYVWTVGDRWDTVAERFGIPKTDWWILLDVNPHIEFPLAMRPGMVINIPDTVRRRQT